MSPAKRRAYDVIMLTRSKAAVWTVVIIIIAMTMFMVLSS